jgi:hypothetical protein
MRRLEYDRYGAQGGDADLGGHFAAMEAPDLLVGDVRKFFHRYR